MFRPGEVVIRQALQHFKRNAQTALLEMRANFSHNTLIIFGFIFHSYTKTFNIDKKFKK
jgi:hypothetical protein